MPSVDLPADEISAWLKDYFNNGPQKKRPAECAKVPVNCANDTKNYYFRSLDGSCNNMAYPAWGMSNTRYIRFVPPRFGDGIHAPRTSVTGEPLPNSRDLSLSLYGEQTLPDHFRTKACLIWGQVLAHDISSLSTSHAPGKLVIFYHIYMNRINYSINFQMIAVKKVRTNLVIQFQFALMITLPQDLQKLVFILPEPLMMLKPTVPQQVSAILRKFQLPLPILICLMYMVIQKMPAIRFVCTREDFWKFPTSMAEFSLQLFPTMIMNVVMKICSNVLELLINVIILNPLVLHSIPY